MVSPLKALKADQVQKVAGKGVKVAAITQDVTAGERQGILTAPKAIQSGVDEHVIQYYLLQIWQFLINDSDFISIVYVGMKY